MTKKISEQFITTLISMINNPNIRSYDYFIITE